MNRFRNLLAIGSLAVVAAVGCSPKPAPAPAPAPTPAPTPATAAARGWSAAEAVVIEVTTPKLPSTQEVPAVGAALRTTHLQGDDDWERSLAAPVPDALFEVARRNRRVNQAPPAAAAPAATVPDTTPAVKPEEKPSATVCGPGGCNNGDQFRYRYGSRGWGANGGTTWAQRYRARWGW